MNLTAKLVSSFAAVIASAVLAGAAGIYTVDTAAEAYAKVIAVDGVHEREAHDALVDFKVQVQEWKNTLLRGSDAKLLDKHWAAFEKQEALVRKSVSHLQSGLPAGAEKDLATAFLSAHEAMSIGYRKAFVAFRDSGFDSALGDQLVRGMDREPTALLDKLSDGLSARAKEDVARATDLRKNALVIASVLMVLMVVVAGMVGAVLIRSLMRQMGGEPALAQSIATEIADGNLAVAVPLRQGDTTSLLATMDHMRLALTKVIVQVRTSSAAVAAGSLQIASGSGDLSHRTEVQASALQQTAASMDELSSTVQNNAAHAEKAAHLATSASETAVRGGAAVARVVDTMKDIDASSKRIADIIGTIDSIAFQTNILALNAAVEAARAGDQGRGFAVVASEVRALAQKSASAAKEIKTLISASGEHVAAGSRLADDAGSTMQAVVEAIRGVTDVVSEISHSSKEQSIGVAQVGAAVTQLDQTTQQNAALVEESAAAAENLKQQAAQMKQTVDLFRIDRTTVQPA